AEAFLIVGSETFLDLLTWRTPRRVAELAQIVVVPRAGSAFDPDSAAMQKVVHEIGEAPLIVRATSLPISASDIRSRVREGGAVVVRARSWPISASDIGRGVREGRSIAYRVPDAIAAYIRTKRLYRDEGA